MSAPGLVATWVFSLWQFIKKYTLGLCACFSTCYTLKRIKFGKIIIRKIHLRIWIFWVSLLSLSNHFLTSRNKNSAIQHSQNCQAMIKNCQVIAYSTYHRPDITLSSLHTVYISILKKVLQGN